MRILLSFRPELKSAPFEVTRLRKNIKGALELADVSYTENSGASPDIVHLISPLEIDSWEFAKEEDIPYVVSALYCEDDKDGRFIEYDKDDKTYLPPKALKMLEGASRIFVPNSKAKDLLAKLGLINPSVTVIPSGVNLARFEKGDPLELELFPHYFRFPKTQKFVLSIGNYKNEENIKKLKNIANLMPNIIFFMFWEKEMGSERYIKKILKDAPRNILISNILNDDLYRSGMMGASAFLILDKNYCDTSLYEAFAAKTPVIVYGDETYFTDALSKKTAFVSIDPTKIAETLISFSPLDDNSTIIASYELAESSSLRLIGRKLLEEYKRILDSRKDFL